MTATVAAIGVSLVIMAVITWVVKRHSPARPHGARHAVSQPPVHLPSDDPHWLEHSQRQARRPRRGQQQRRKIWAAGTAGAVGAGATDPGGSCGGGSSCGGGGCGGGCGGGG